MDNRIKTFILLALLTALMLWVGQFFGGTTGLAIAFIIVLLLNGISYFFSDKIVLALYHAKEVGKDHKLYKAVREVADKARVPMPKVYTVPSRNPNAFATGRDPNHSAVACTESLLVILDDDELKGVIAHEISHIKNRDTLIQTIAATIAGVISYAASMARWGFLGGRDRDESILQLLILAIIAPIVATLLQLALSRSREYMADASAAKMTMKPVSLADALLKIEKVGKENPMGFGEPTTSSLFISNPFHGGILNLFSTHPPISERVKKLRAMKLTHD